MRNDLNAAVGFEWSKVRTLRSMLWSLVLCVVLSLAFAVLTGAVVQHHYAHKPAPRPSTRSLPDSAGCGWG